ncbi:hypothetical protein [Alysiella filiformis]|uniref:Lipoprotein n=1 Tax=Alysiella filiformis DSM 16848 TaxID=1120981 RepID=A0A286E6H3_9NEIS|nr:hypothetical protein [Alysiella filiformis]QMT31490.1 hypothetical protein H3L97_00820 [Alysiella filiformis]UBQ55498.1 hypothetical protein JF568_07855 [Alysiella filiformis DSM 16848]SOD66479.1 hypothetical protein SAMN02746062_00621 [Alysiella filiformis DSM 16848]
MKNWIYLLLIVFTACTQPNTLENKSNTNINHIKKEMELPTYPPLLEGVLMLSLGTSGQLKMVNGCVGLNYSDRDKIFDILLIFPQGTKIINQGKSIQFFNSKDKVFHDGDFVITGGDIPSEERPSNINIPSHCHGKKYLAAPNMHLNKKH